VSARSAIDDSPRWHSRLAAKKPRLEEKATGGASSVVCANTHRPASRRAATRCDCISRHIFPFHSSMIHFAALRRSSSSSSSSSGSWLYQVQSDRVRAGRDATRGPSVRLITHVNTHCSLLDGRGGKGDGLIFLRGRFARLASFHLSRQFPPKQFRFDNSANLPTPKRRKAAPPPRSSRAIDVLWCFLVCFFPFSFVSSSSRCSRRGRK